MILGTQTIQGEVPHYEELSTVLSAVKASDPEILSFRNKTLRKRYDENQAIKSVGYRLFDDAVFSSEDSILFDFVERYFLMLDATTDADARQRRMNDDKVRILNGNIASMVNMSNPTHVVRLDKTSEMQRTIITITDEDSLNQVNFKLEFPVSMELLTRCSRGEMEKNLPDKIYSYAKTKETEKLPIQVSHEEDGIEYVGGMNYYLESLTDCTYYTTVGDNNLHVIFSADEKDKSLANLMMGATAEDRRMELVEKLYGYDEQRISTSIFQWVNYCYDNGIKLYFAIEKEAEDGFLILMIGVNDYLKYNHLLSAVVPWDFMENPNSVVKGTLTAFIPTHNVDNLYDKKAVFHKKNIEVIK